MTLTRFSFITLWGIPSISLRDPINSINWHSFQRSFSFVRDVETRASPTSVARQEIHAFQRSLIIRKAGLHTRVWPNPQVTRIQIAVSRTVGVCYDFAPTQDTVIDGPVNPIRVIDRLTVMSEFFRSILNKGLLLNQDAARWIDRDCNFCASSWSRIMGAIKNRALISEIKLPRKMMQ